MNYFLKSLHYSDETDFYEQKSQQKLGPFTENSIKIDRNVEKLTEEENLDKYPPQRQKSDPPTKFSTKFRCKAKWETD